MRSAIVLKYKDKVIKWLLIRYKHTFGLQLADMQQLMVGADLPGRKLKAELHKVKKISDKACELLRFILPLKKVASATAQVLWQT